jgi:hypothetical protein
MTDRVGLDRHTRAINRAGLGDRLGFEDYPGWF